jgi:hypothetical protein
MTGDESRELEIGDRVFWGADKNDQGTSERFGMKSSLIGTMARRLRSSTTIWRVLNARKLPV